MHCYIQWYLIISFCPIAVSIFTALGAQRSPDFTVIYTNF
jgi:hypothetical protein